MTDRASEETLELIRIIANQGRDFDTEVSKGNVPGHSWINKFGHNASASAGDDVWSGGGEYGFYPAIAEALEIVSDSVEDDPLKADPVEPGTGAFEVFVEGLDAAWDIQNELVVTNGLGAIALANSYIRVYRAFVTDCGTDNMNAGTILIQGTGGGTVAAVISDGGIADGQTQQLIYTIPDGVTGIFKKGYVGLSDPTFQGVAAEFVWQLRLNDGVKNGSWLTKGQMGVVNIGSSHWQYEYGIPAGPVPERTDIRIKVIAGTDANVVAGVDMMLVDNAYMNLA